MDNFQKYSRLMLLLAGGVAGFVLVVALLFYLLRLFSIAVFNIPGFDVFYQFTVLIIPYIIFFAAYVYLFGKMKLSANKASRLLALLFIIAGALFCTFTLVLTIMIFLKVMNPWLRLAEENSHYAFIIQLIVLLITAGIIGSGDVKEKDWMQRRL